MKAFAALKLAAVSKSRFYKTVSAKNDKNYTNVSVL
jgi:hypothetical protein